MKKDETFAVAGIARFAANLEKLAEHNPDYDLTRTQLMEKGLVGQRIYEDIYPCEEVSLKLCPWPEEKEKTPDETPSRQDEKATDAVPSQQDEKTSDAVPSQQDEKTSDAVPSQQDEKTPELMPGVFVSDEQVGFIRKAGCSRVCELIDSNRIISMSLSMHGGPYRILLENDTDEPVMDEAKAGMFASLTITYEEDEPEPAANKDDDNSARNSYISTSYDTITVDTSKKRGTVPLVFALLIGGFYAGFSIPYWILVRQRLISPLPVFGGDIADQLLNPHMALVIAALLVAAAGMVVRVWVLPMLAALLFTGACYTVPGYAVFTLLPALLCSIAALRRHSRRKIMILFRILTLLAVLGASAYFLKDTAIRAWKTRQLAITPTSQSEVVPIFSLPGAQVQADDDLSDDAGDWSDEVSLDDEDEDDDDDWDDDEDWDDEDDDGGFVGGSGQMFG